MKDPYDVLGVARSASAADIRRAYRKLAKELHPDLHPDQPDLEVRFKEVTAAYELLSDADKRARYDRGEIDASGAERPRQRFYREYAEQPAGAKYGGFEDIDDVESILGGIFGRRGGGGRMRIRGADLHYTLAVDFLDAVNGARKRVTMPDGRTLDIAIPAGIEHDHTLRLARQGQPGIGGGPPGDALVKIAVTPHPLFRRQGDDIHLELPVTLGEAVLGGKAPVPTVSGTVTVTVPKGSDSGTVLRLKGKGAVSHRTKRRGDQYVTLKIVLPKPVDDALASFVAEWAPKHPYDPRRDLMGKGKR